MFLNKELLYVGCPLSLAVCCEPKVLAIEPSSDLGAQSEPSKLADLEGVSQAMSLSLIGHYAL